MIPSYHRNQQSTYVHFSHASCLKHFGTIACSLMSNHRRFASSAIAKPSCCVLSYWAAATTGTMCCSGVAGVWHLQLVGTMRAEMLLEVEVEKAAMIDIVEICLIDR